MSARPARDIIGTVTGRIPLDPHRCPDCGAPLAAGGTTCPACGLLVTGPYASALWQVATQLDALEDRREALLAALRPGGAAWQPAAPTPPAPAPVRRNAWPEAAAAWPAGPPVRQRAEWTPRRVQNLLLGLGVLLVVVAAVIFTAFAWGRLPLPARGAIMLAGTLAAAAGSAAALRRGLVASAEALSVLALALATVDAYALRRAGLFGLGGTDAATYWSVATGVLAAVAAGYATAVRVRAPRYAALLGAQLPVLVTAARLDGLTAATRGALLLGQAGVLAVAAPRLFRALRPPAYLTAGANWAVGTLLAVATAFGSPDRSDVRGAAVALVLAAAVAVAAALLWPPDARHGGTGLATVCLALAVIGPARLGLTGVQLPAAVAAIGLLAVVAAGLLPASWRLGPLTVGSGTTGLALLMVAADAVTGLAGPLSWLADPWRVTGNPAARTVVTADAPWHGSVVVLVVLAVFALAAVVVSELLGVRRQVAPAVALVAAWAFTLVPLGQAWSYRVAVGWDVVAGGIAVLAGAWWQGRRPVLALSCLVAGTGVLGAGVAWSAASRPATLAALGFAAIVYVVVAAFDGVARPVAAGLATALLATYAGVVAAAVHAPAGRCGFVVAAAAVALVAAGRLMRDRRPDGDVVQGVAVVAYVTGVLLSTADVRWLAWSLGIGAVAAAVEAFRPDRDAAVRAVVAGAAAGLAAGATGATARAVLTPVDRTGFAVAVAACALLGLGGWVLRDRPQGEAVEAVAAVAYAVGLLATLGDPGWLSWALATGAVSAFALALRADRRGAAWAGGVLLDACSWVRLYLEGVRAPEAYAAPLAAVALVLGYLRRRQDPSVSSWSAYGSGLLVAFGPSLYIVMTDPGLTRRLLLGLAALAVLLAGVRGRLKAPLAIGATVLAIDAVLQLAPYAAALPKWASIGGTGLLLLVVGVTYEQRRRDVDRLRERFSALA